MFKYATTITGMADLTTTVAFVAFRAVGTGRVDVAGTVHENNIQEMKKIVNEIFVKKFFLIILMSYGGLCKGV